MDDSEQKLFARQGSDAGASKNCTAEFVRIAVTPVWANDAYT